MDLGTSKPHRHPGGQECWFVMEQSCLAPGMSYAPRSGYEHSAGSGCPSKKVNNALSGCWLLW